MTGELQGHWEYVIAAYAVTWLFFAGYAYSLWYRARKLRSLEKLDGSKLSSGGHHD